MLGLIALALISQIVVPEWVATGGIIWHRDYAVAKEMARREQKLLAVIVGRGTLGWRELLRDGTWDATIRGLLRADYVAVYLNQDNAADRAWVSAMGLSGQVGLVLSDRGGSLMAYRHVGRMSATELVHQMTRFADPKTVVQTTQGHGAPWPQGDAVGGAAAGLSNAFGGPNCLT